MVVVALATHCPAHHHTTTERANALLPATPAPCRVLPPCIAHCLAFCRPHARAHLPLPPLLPSELLPPHVPTPGCDRTTTHALCPYPSACALCPAPRPHSPGSFPLPFAGYLQTTCYVAVPLLTLRNVAHCLYLQLCSIQFCCVRTTCVTRLPPAPTRFPASRVPADLRAHCQFQVRFHSGWTLHCLQPAATALPLR